MFSEAGNFITLVKKAIIKICQGVMKLYSNESVKFLGNHKVCCCYI